MLLPLSTDFWVILSFLLMIMVSLIKEPNLNKRKPQHVMFPLSFTIVIVGASKKGRTRPINGISITKEIKTK